MKEVISLLFLIFLGESSRRHMVQVLQPLEVGDSDSPCIGDQIGDHWDSFFFQDLVCLESSWTVSTLNH